MSVTRVGPPVVQYVLGRSRWVRVWKKVSLAPQVLSSGAPRSLIHGWRWKRDELPHPHAPVPPLPVVVARVVAAVVRASCCRCSVHEAAILRARSDSRLQRGSPPYVARKAGVRSDRGPPASADARCARIGAAVDPRTKRPHRVQCPFHQPCHHVHAIEVHRTSSAIAHRRARSLKGKLRRRGDCARSGGRGCRF